MSDRIGALNKLFYELDNNLCTDEVEVIRSCLRGDQITKKELEGLKNFTDILHSLKDKGIIAEDNLNLIKNLLTIIKRKPLIKQVEQCEEKMTRMKGDASSGDKREIRREERKETQTGARTTLHGLHWTSILFVFIPIIAIIIAFLYTW